MIGFRMTLKEVVVGFVKVELLPEHLLGQTEKNYKLCSQNWWSQYSDFQSGTPRE